MRAVLPLLMAAALALAGALRAPAQPESPHHLDLSSAESVTTFFLAHGFEAVPPDLVPQQNWMRETRTCRQANAAVGGDPELAGLVGLFMRRSDRLLHALCYFDPQARLQPQHAAHACHLVGLVLDHQSGTEVWCREGGRA